MALFVKAYFVSHTNRAWPNWCIFVKENRKYFQIYPSELNLGLYDILNDTNNVIFASKLTVFDVNIIFSGHTVLPNDYTEVQQLKHIQTSSIIQQLQHKMWMDEV